MTAKQRRKRSRQNATLNATGPVTVAGKEVSRRNRLTHGFTAKTLTLSSEDPEVIQAKADRWYDAYRPEGPAEEALTDQAHLASLRLERIAAAERETLDEQGRNAETALDLYQNLQLVKFRRMLHRDRITAILNLRSFGAGVSWLLGRWKYLESAFKSAQCWNNLSLIREAILLRGFHDDRIDAQMGTGFEFAYLAVSCVNGYENIPELAQFLSSYDDEGVACIAESKSVTEMVRSMTSYIPAACLSSKNVRTLPLSEARQTMRMWIERQVADLRELDRHFREVDAQSRAGAKVRAQTPADTPQNRLLLRYMKSAENALDRALKTLSKLQRERRREAEIEAQSEPDEAPKTELRNEPNEAARSHSSVKATGGCVTPHEPVCVAPNGTVGTLNPAPVSTMPEAKPWEVASPSKNGV